MSTLQTVFLVVLLGGVLSICGSCLAVAFQKIARKTFDFWLLGGVVVSALALFSLPLARGVHLNEQLLWKSGCRIELAEGKFVAEIKDESLKFFNQTGGNVPVVIWLSSSEEKPVIGGAIPSGSFTITGLNEWPRLSFPGIWLAVYGTKSESIDTRAINTRECALAQQGGKER